MFGPNLDRNPLPLFALFHFPHFYYVAHVLACAAHYVLRKGNKSCFIPKPAALDISPNLSVLMSARLDPIPSSACRQALTLTRFHLIGHVSSAKRQ